MLDVAVFSLFGIHNLELGGLNGSLSFFSTCI